MITRASRIIYDPQIFVREPQLRQTRYVQPVYIEGIRKDQSGVLAPHGGIFFVPSALIYTGRLARRASLEISRQTIAHVPVLPDIPALMDFLERLLGTEVARLLPLGAVPLSIMGNIFNLPEDWKREIYLAHQQSGAHLVYSEKEGISFLVTPQDNIMLDHCWEIKGVLVAEKLTGAKQIPDLETLYDILLAPPKLDLKPLPPTAVIEEVAREVEAGWAYGLTDGNLSAFRPNNEDGFLIFEHNGKKIVIIADGMGGKAAGQEAARLAIQVVYSALMAGSSLKDALRAAHQAILLAAKADPLKKGMGTTLDVVVLEGEQMEVGHLGDSRVYRVGSQGESELLTRDESERWLYGEAALDRGEISLPVSTANLRAIEGAYDALVARGALEESAGLYNNLGGQRIKFNTKTWPIRSGDWLLLCTDGLSGPLQDLLADLLIDLRMSGGSLETAAKRLLGIAKRKGNDNISLVLVDTERL